MKGKLWSPRVAFFLSHSQLDWMDDFDWFGHGKVMVRSVELGVSSLVQEVDGFSLEMYLVFGSFLCVCSLLEKWKFGLVVNGSELEGSLRAFFSGV